MDRHGIFSAMFQEILSPMLVLPQKPETSDLGYRALLQAHVHSTWAVMSDFDQHDSQDLPNGRNSADDLLPQSKKALFSTVRRVAETLQECLGEPSRDKCHLKRLKPGCMISDLVLVSQYMTQVKEDCNSSDCGDDPFITGRVRSVQFPTLHHNANSSDPCHLALRMHRAYSIILP